VGTHSLAAPRLVPREESSDGAGAPKRLRLVGVPDVRRDARRDDVGRPPASPEVSVTQELRLLGCEGSCSTRRGQFLDSERALLAAGYSPYSTRAVESATLTPTPHYFVRTWTLAHTVYQTWACEACGTERTYGAEEA